MRDMEFYDGNLHGGENIVKGDPNPQNKNGKLFVEFLARNKLLIVINSLNDCEGVITRRRKLENRTEEVIFDDKMRPFFKKMDIDESREFCLANLDRAKKNGKMIETDRNSMMIEFDILHSTQRVRSTPKMKKKSSLASNMFIDYMGHPAYKMLKIKIKNWRNKKIAFFQVILGAS